MERTILRMIDEAAERHGADPYLMRKTDAGFAGWTFSETRDKARSVAKALVARGFRKGDTAAILAEGDPAWVAFELGLLMAGMVSVPLSIKLQSDEVPFRLNHSECAVIMVSRFTLDKVLPVLARIDRKDLLFVVIDLGGADPAEFARGKGLEPGRVVEFEALAAEGDTAGPVAAGELEARRAACREDDTATVCYTSGTTGNPKGIMLSHLNYWANCHDGVAVFELPLRFKTLVMLPIDHSFAHTVAIYAAFLCGICLYFVDARGGPASILRNIPANLKEANANFLLTVPALTGNFMKKMRQAVEEKGGIALKLFESGLRAGIKYHGDGFRKPSLGLRLSTFFPRLLARLLVFPKLRAVFGDDIRYCVGGGALLDIKQQEFFMAIGVPVYQGYGLTEAAPIICANTPARHKFGSSGMVLPSVTCRIMKEEGGKELECAVGERGEIVIKGDNVMKGYLKNPEATAKAIREGWLWTGDLGYYDADGFLVVTGREKALLIAEDGEKYSPEDIEETIMATAQVVSQVMLYNDHRKYTSCLVYLDPAGAKKLAARSESPADFVEAVRADLFKFREDPAMARRFPAQWLPATFLLLEEGFTEQNLLLNSTMKMVRHKIAERYAADIEYLYTKEGSVPANGRNLEMAGRMLPS